MFQLNQVFQLLFLEQKTYACNHNKILRSNKQSKSIRCLQCWVLPYNNKMIRQTKEIIDLTMTLTQKKKHMNWLRQDMKISNFLNLPPRFWFWFHGKSFGLGSHEMVWREEAELCLYEGLSLSPTQAP